MIRLITTKDIERVNELYFALFKLTAKTEPHYHKPTYQDKDFLERVVEQKNGFVGYVFEKDGIVTGFAIAQLQNTNTIALKLAITKTQTIFEKKIKNDMNIYAYQRLVGKIDDIPELRNEFISIFDIKDKKQMAQFGLLYGQHILDITGTEPCTEITRAFEAVREWIDDKANYHKARNISFRHLYKNVREETDIIRKKFYITMGQIASIPHVKAHGLWATDFAITLINRMYPDNMDEVRKERGTQIELIKQV